MSNLKPIASAISIVIERCFERGLQDNEQPVQPLIAALKEIEPIAAELEPSDQDQLGKLICKFAFVWNTPQSRLKRYRQLKVLKGADTGFRSRYGF